MTIYMLVMATKGLTVLLPGFAIIWQQNQVTRQPHLCDLTHIIFI